MRTTIDIPASLYQRLKARAGNEGSSAKKLILRGVEQVLRAILSAVPQRHEHMLEILGARPDGVVAQRLARDPRLVPDPDERRAELPGWTRR